MQILNLTFTNNQNWFFARGMAQWAALYDLSAGEFRMQARVSATNRNVIYAWSSVSTESTGGTIIYDPATGLLTIAAPYADMPRLAPGSYVYDLQFRPTNVSATLAVDIFGGSLTVTQGVTRS